MNSLQNLSDLDAAQSAFVSNDAADMCPPLQRCLIDLLACERMRRDGVEIEGYPLPEFSEWKCENILLAGTAILICSEAAAMAGEPTLQDFSWRLLQYFYRGLAQAMAREVPV